MTLDTVRNGRNRRKQRAKIVTIWRTSDISVLLRAYSVIRNFGRELLEGASQEHMLSQKMEQEHCKGPPRLSVATAMWSPSRPGKRTCTEGVSTRNEGTTMSAKARTINGMPSGVDRKEWTASDKNVYIRDRDWGMALWWFVKRKVYF